jgi:uncharacterized membrane protein
VVTANLVAAGTELLERLFDLWSKILTFRISFIVLAIYWQMYGN